MGDQPGPLVAALRPRLSGPTRGRRDHRSCRSPPGPGRRRHQRGHQASPLEEHERPADEGKRRPTREQRPDDGQVTGRRRLAAMAAVTGGLWIPLLIAERGLWRNGGPGIVGLELAGSWEAVERIGVHWGPQGRSWARKSLLLDFPFLVAYGTFGWLCARSASDALRDANRPKLAGLGRPVGWGAAAAAGCDLVEDAALLCALSGRRGLPYPGLARRCALTKFAFLGFGVSYLLVAACVCSSHRRKTIRRADR